MSAPTGNPLEPLSFAPDFRASEYEIKPGTERRWRGMTERIYADHDGWFDHPEIARTVPVLSIWFFDGPMVEVTDIDTAPHDARDGYGCLDVADNGFPEAVGERQEVRCVCGRWWVARRVGASPDTLEWQRPGRLPPP